MFTGKKLFTVAALCSMLAAGCSGGGTVTQQGAKEDVAKPPEKPEDLKPVELSILYPFGEAGFKVVEESLKKRWPHITLKWVQKLEPEMVATGNVPDLLWNNIPQDIQRVLVAQNLQYDMSDYIAKNKLDLSKFWKEQIQEIRNNSDGKLYGLPVSRNVNYLYYNKDIFDKFGVPYPDPKNPMTWDEVYEVAKKLTRTEGGIKYRGFDFVNVGLSQQQFETTRLDPKTDEPIMAKTPAFKKYLEHWQRMVNIPGILLDDPTKQFANTGATNFTRDRNVAMFTMWHTFRPLITAENEQGLKWNIAPYPVWDRKDPKNPNILGQILSISPTSKHKEDVFRAIMHLVSEEHQLAGSKIANGSSLNTPEIVKAFASELPGMETKNRQAGFVSAPAVAPVSSIYEIHVGMNMNDLIGNKKDINTILREADENAAKKVAEEKAKRK